MKQVVRRKIKDKRLLMLLDEIIDSTESGVPIGNYLSQFFANLYLAELDHLVKEQMDVRYYYRFADDIVLLSSTKAELHGQLVTINDYLNTTRKLTIKKNFQIFPVSSRGINYVGYITYPTHCLARKENKKKLARQVASLRKQNFTNEEIRIRAASRLGFMVHCDSIHFLKTIDMKTFSEITNVQGNLTGDKYHIDTIIDREIHLKKYEVSQSKYKGECLTIQYEILEQLIGADKVPMLNEDGSPKTGWVEHITFTGSEALVKQLKGVELTEPVRCMIIKQPIGDKGKFFYKLTDPG